MMKKPRETSLLIWSIDGLFGTGSLARHKNMPQCLDAPDGAIHVYPVPQLMHHRAKKVRHTPNELETLISGIP